MIQREPNIILSSDSRRIAVQDFKRNQTLVYDISSNQITDTIDQVFSISTFSQDQATLYHVNFQDHLIREGFEDSISKLLGEPQDIEIFDDSKIFIYAVRSNQLNQGTIITEQFGIGPINKISDVPLFSIVNLESSKDASLIILSSQEAIGNQKEIFIEDNRGDFNFDENELLEPEKYYNHWLVDNLMIWSNKNEVYIQNENHKLELPPSPNYITILTPDRSKILMYKIGELKNHDEMKINVKIIDVNKLNLLEDEVYTMKSSALPLLVINNEKIISQVQYRDGVIKISPLK